MTTYKPIDYEALCDELMEHYLSPEYYQATKSQIKYVTSKVTATTIDEYIKFLSEGYINVEIREELEKYLDELLENEWFHQWPLVRLKYVLRSMRRKTEINYEKTKKCKGNLDCEIKILDSLAKEGWPNAIKEIGIYNYIYGGGSKHNYESYICLCVYSSRKGCLTAGSCLYSEFITGKYEQLCEELQMFVLEEAAAWLLVDRGASSENYEEKLYKYDLEYYKKMCRSFKVLKKSVSERIYMRETVGRLGWPEGESPYEIKY